MQNKNHNYNLWALNHVIRTNSKNRLITWSVADVLYALKPSLVWILDERMNIQYYIYFKRSRNIHYDLYILEIDTTIEHIRVIVGKLAKY